MRMELVIRFDYGSIVPWVRDRRRHGSAPSPARTPWRAPGPAARRGTDDGRGRSWSKRRARPVRADLAPVAHEPSAAARSARRSPTPRRFWTDWSGALHVPRRVPGRGEPVAAHAQGAHVRAHRRHRRRADDVAPRAASAASATGTTASAGCATRRSRWTRSWAAATTRRRAPGATGCCAPSPAPRRPDHVRGPGRAPPARVRDPWLPATRARGRCGSATRRTQFQLDVYGEVVDALSRRAGRPRPTSAAWRSSAQSRGIPRVVWQRAGRGHLGGARRAAVTSRTRR